MALTYKTKSSDFKRIPAGSHIAVCDIVADVGLQETFFGTKQQCYLRFEVPDERWQYEKDGKQQEGPGVIGNFYTASMSKKANLRQLLENWRGRQFTKEEAENFDISSILGKPCMLSVVESESSDGTKYSNIASVSPLPKGIPAPKAELPLLFYYEGDKSQYSKLPEWIRKKIENQVPEPDAQEPAIQRGDTDFNPVDDTEITDADIPW